MTRMDMPAFFKRGHTSIDSHTEEDRNAYGIILLAKFYLYGAAFQMFALATRLSQTPDPPRDARLKNLSLKTTKVSRSR